MSKTRKWLNIVLVGLLWLAAIVSVVNPVVPATQKFQIKSPYNNTNLAVKVVENKSPAPITPSPIMLAKGWVLIDAASGRIICSDNSNEKLSMASTTKIMTALITLNQPNLDDYFEVDTDAITVEGSSMGLKPGDMVSLRTLAAGMLLPSANDGARAAAVRIAGNETEFAKIMNKNAKDIGMVNSKFSTASGLDQGEHYSTAYDMAILTAQALKNEQFAAIASSKTLQVAYGAPPYTRTLYNHNKLLEHYSEAIGVKTGFTKKAGRCLVSAAERDGLTLICVTLNAADDFNSHKIMYEWAFDNLQFNNMGDRVSNVSVAVVGGLSERVSLKPAWDFGAYLTAGEAVHVSVSVNIPRFVYAPINQGQHIGQATMTLDNVQIATVPIIATHQVDSLPKKGLFSFVRLP